jgi:hypothetical protein
MVNTSLNIFVEAMRQLVYQMAGLFPKIILAVVIWVFGKYFLNLGIQLLKRINIKGTDLDDQIVAFLTKVALPLGKFILALIVLDYLGVGRTIIGAVMNGLTLAVAIALGFAFGQALTEDAKRVVSEIRKHVKK